MVENSTLFYLLDDFSNPPDMILTPYYEQTSPDDFLNLCLNMMEYDPGEEIVKGIVQRAAHESEPLQ